MTKASVATLIAIILFCVGAVPAVAFDGTTMSVGGPGGAPFAESCRPGEALVSVGYEAGKDIESVTPGCAALSNGLPVGEIEFLARQGEHLVNGHFGTLDTLACPQGMVIQQVHASKSAAQLVHQFWFTCRNLLTGAHTDTSRSITNGGKGGAPGYSDCGGDSYASGLSGRVDTPIHALGLVCATFHAAVQSPPPNSPPPALPPPAKKAPHPVDNARPPHPVDNGG